VDNNLVDHRGEVVYQPLGFAKGIGGEHRRQTGSNIRPVPLHDFPKHFCLRAPTEHREGKRTFSNEEIAPKLFKRIAEPVGFQLVITGDDSDVTLVFDVNLRRSGDMARRVERQLDSVPNHSFAVAERQAGDAAVQPPTHERKGNRVGNVLAMAGTRMVCVSVRYDCAVDSMTGIDVEIPAFAIEPVIGEPEKIIHS
jgi:hypothetical protein